MRMKSKKPNIETEFHPNSDSLLMGSHNVKAKHKKEEQKQQLTVFEAISRCGSNTDDS